VGGLVLKCPMGWLESKPENSVESLPVALRTGIGSQHVDDSLFVVDPVEKTVAADSIAPCRGVVIPQFLDVLSKIRIVPELRVNVLSELIHDPFMLSLEIL